MKLARTLFWASSAAIVHTHAGYPLSLWLLSKARRRRDPSTAHRPPPTVSLIIAARNEAAVIGQKIANARALDPPPDEIIVSSNDSSDGTAAAARDAGADLVLELGQAGKVRAQDAAVERANGEILFFSDANSTLAPDALRRLLAPFADPQVGYVCGQVRFVHGDGGATNQEGVYWRYEMALRALVGAFADAKVGYACGQVRFVNEDDGTIFSVARAAGSYRAFQPRLTMLNGNDRSWPMRGSTTT